jgi:hypothetical protein
MLDGFSTFVIGQKKEDNTTTIVVNENVFINGSI